jgi:hypothetical protein
MLDFEITQSQKNNINRNQTRIPHQCLLQA